MIMGSLSPWRLSLLYKILGGLVLYCIMGTMDMFAIQISAVYSSGCSREIGVFLDVNKSKVSLLNLEGEVKVIPRYNISYISQYPVGKLPIKAVNYHPNTRLVEIKTLYKNEPVELVNGWMIDYAEDQISFLTQAGDDTVIDVSDIWDFQMAPQKEKITFSTNGTFPKYQFIHPYPFIHCQKEESKKGDPYRIYPQHLMEEPVLIKAELDRLQEGFDRLEAYDSDKKFYPEPHTYNNSVKLNIWGSLGLRHAVSKNRNSSFIPSVASQLSEGPYGFQRVWVTGSAPMPYSVHEEPQIQAYYRMKSDFVHLSVNYDISRLLVGEDAYHWKKDDLRSEDSRWNEKFHVAGGVDYSHYSIEYSITDVEYAMKGGGSFFTDSFFLNKFGAFFYFKNIDIDLYYGIGKDSKEELELDKDSDSEEEEAYKEKLQSDYDKKSDFNGKFTFFRVNLNLKSFEDLEPRYSLIYRMIDFEKDPDYWGNGEFKYKGNSFTNALYLSYSLGYDLSMTGFIAVEYLESKYGTTGLDHKASASYAKGGASLALTF